MRHLLERVALDDIIGKVLGEISQLDAAFKTRANLFNVVLKTPPRSKTTIVDWFVPSP